MGTLYPTEETWRDVPGHPGYVASSKGRIKGPRGALLSQRPAKTGARMVSVSGVNMMVHRLVYAAFTGPIRSGNQVRHRNQNLADNRIENLYEPKRFGGVPAHRGDKCSKGHELVGDNVRLRNNNRICVPCERGDAPCFELPEVL